jgi:hypothetical protein
MLTDEGKKDMDKIVMDCSPYLEIKADRDQKAEEGIYGGDSAGIEVDGGVGADDEGGTRDAVAGSEGFASV